MIFNEQKREATATAKHLVEILGDVCDESPSATQHERQWLCDTSNRIKYERKPFDGNRHERRKAAAIDRRKKEAKP